MRLNSFPQLEARVFYNEDDGGGDGGKTFTKEEVEQMIQGRLAKTKADHAALQAALEREKQTNSTKLAELQAQLEELKTPAPPEVKPDDVEGRLKLEQSKHAKQIEELNKSLQALTKEKELERSKRMKSERDRELILALREAGCRNDAEAVGLNHFVNRLSWDEADERWIYTLEKGGTVSVKEGVAEELPDYLKEPTMQRGGSGSSSGGKNAGKLKGLEEAKAKLKAMEEHAAKSGRDGDILRYQSQKRIVGQLEKELATSK